VTAFVFDGLSSKGNRVPLARHVALFDWLGAWDQSANHGHLRPMVGTRGVPHIAFDYRDIPCKAIAIGLSRTERDLPDVEPRGRRSWPVLRVHARGASRIAAQHAVGDVSVGAPVRFGTNRAHRDRGFL
jgi:hypothetical protein